MITLKRIMPWLVLVVYFSALAYEGVRGTFGETAALVGVLCGWFVVVVKIRSINPYGLISGLCFGLLGIVGLWVSNAAFWPELMRSQYAFLKFILLYGSVVWLRIQASNSRSLAQLAQWIMAVGEDTRKLALPLGGYLMGAGFNLAGLGLLTPMVQSARTMDEQREKFVLMINGFSLATAWSPVFASAIVVLAAFPNLSWLEIAPKAAFISLGLFAINQLILRFRTMGRVKGPADFSDDCSQAGRNENIICFPLTPGMIVGLLLCSLVLCVWWTNWAVSVSLGLIAPVFSIVWLLTSDSFKCDFARYFRDVLNALGKLHSEIWVFAMVNLLAVGGAAVIEGNDLVQPLEAQWPGLNWFLFALSYLLVTGAGAHPLAIVLVGVQLIPATSLGISELQYALLILGLWTSSTMGSPLSANNLMFSKVLGHPVWRLAWLWNGKAALINWGCVVLLGLAWSVF